jgi:carboxyvinyl-carboxyphosphonate phosphorylmutase
MKRKMNYPQKFRELLNDTKFIMAPGAFDCISARLIEEAGFPAVYLSGAGVASSRLGKPDVGLTTMTEALDAARNVVNSTNIPVICDADTGFGNAINVIRTTQMFEQAGVAAIQLEDQVSPKKCGHVEHKLLIDKDEMVTKIKAFLYARYSPDFALIARTDANTVTGLEDAIERAKTYAEAGADIIFVESPMTVEEMEEIANRLAGIPLMINIVDGKGKTPVLPAEDLEKMGYKMAIYPGTAWMATIKAIQGVLEELKSKGTAIGFSDKMSTFKEMFEVVNLEKYISLERQFLDELT